MIHTNRVVTVGDQESIIDKPIVLYRGDREVEVEFELIGNEFMFSTEGNVIKSVNASHGQLVLNTPSGDHMFSEVAECHDGKVVFVITKEMIDEFIEMGFYSFQIRLYDGVEMKSRVTIPPVFSGLDIRNPIAAEDETNVVDQGLVGYARVYKDQSNEELPTFDWNGNYNKTEWIHHDVITENKLNKIEDALYSINADAKKFDVEMRNTLNQVTKDADKYVKEHIAEVEQDVEDFERNINTEVGIFKIDTNAAMTAHKNEVSEELEGFSTQLANIENNSLFSEEITVNTSDELIEAIENDNYTKITLRKGIYNIDGVLEINKHIDGKGSTIEVNSPFTTSSSTKLENISFKSISKSNNCINLKGGCKIENCVFTSFDTAINQVDICVHGYIKNCTFQYNKNGIWLSCPDTTSMNNFIIENNYFVKHGENADDLSANGTKDDMVGIGLYLNGGCNHVVIRENVFEYNTFCGICVINTSTAKNNDSKIVCNYFEGNKITSIYVKLQGTSNNQLIIRDNFYSSKMTSNSDYIRDDIVLDSMNNSFNTIYGKQNIPILGPGINIILAADRSYFSFASQYLSIPFDRVIYDMSDDDRCLVYMRYTTKLNSNVTFRDGNKTSLVLHTFENSDGAMRTTIVEMPKNVNKYLNRNLADDEYIRIYEYRML